jgi:hypothetical protein
MRVRKALLSPLVDSAPCKERSRQDVVDSHITSGLRYLHELISRSDRARELSGSLRSRIKYLTYRVRVRRQTLPSAGL